MILNLILITTILVFITDISGIVDALKRLFSRALTKGKISTDNYSIKPLDCSLCQTFWICNFYLLYIGQLTIPTEALVCLLSYLTPVIKDVFYNINSILSFINRVIAQIDKL